MPSEVGHAYISVLPSAEGFDAALKAQIGPAADRAGDDAGRRLGETLKLALEASTADLGGVATRDIANGAAEAGAKAGAEAAAGYREALKAGTEGAGPSSIGGGTGAGSAAGSAAGAGGGMSGLLAAALALSPALVTVGAVGAGALGAIAGAGAAAGISLGAVALVAKPLLTSLEGAATAQQKYTQAVANYGPASTQAATAMNALANATANLSPAEQVAAVQLGNFKNELQAYQQSFDPQILPLFTNGMSLARAAMTDFSPVIKVGATALSGLETQARSALASPYWQNFFTLLAGQGGTAITTFGHLLGGTGTALAGLDRAFGPLITDVEHVLDGLANRLTAFGQEQTHTGIAAFTAYVEREGPLVGRTLGELATAFGTLVKDAAPVGHVYLEIIDAASKLLNEALQFDPVLTSLAIGFGGAALAANKLLGPLGGLSGAFKDAAAAAAGFAGTNLAANASGAEQAFAKLGIAAKASVTSIAEADGAMATLGAVSAVALSPLVLITAAVAALGVAYHVASQSTRDAKAASDSMVQGFTQQAQAAGLAGPALIDFYQKQIDALHAQEQALDKAGDSAGIFERIITGPWQKNTAYKTVADEAKGLQAQLDSLKGTQAGSKQAQEQLNAANAAGAPLAANLTTAQNNLTKAQQNLDTATKQVVTDIDKMLNVFLNADNNALAFKDGLASLVKTVQGTGAGFNNLTGTFDENTVAGRAAEHQMNSVSDAARKIIDDMVNAHAPITDINAKVNDLRAQMEAAGGQIGLTTQQTDAYLGKVGLTTSAVDGLIGPQQTANAAVSAAQGALSGASNAASNYATGIQSIAQAWRDLSAVQGTGGLNLNAPIGVPASNPYSPLIGHAAGTANAPAGYAWVGEKGPELMSFKGGETVVPHDKSVSLAVAYHAMNGPGYAAGVGVQPATAGPSRGPVSISVPVQTNADAHAIAGEVAWQMLLHT